MLNTIKLLLGLTDTSKDSILTALIDICSDDYKSITHTANPDNSVVIQMVLFRYSLLGAEGLNSESYSGVSLNYQVAYPDYIAKQLISNRHIRVVE